METILSYFKVVIFGESNLVQQCVTVSTKIPKQLKEKIQKIQNQAIQDFAKSP
jgi:phage-related holin